MASHIIETKIVSKKNNFLFVSWTSLSGDLAWKVQREGHNVKVFIDNKVEREDVYTGILEKVDDWKKYTDWADIIIFDDIGFGSFADKLRKQGKRVIGGNAYADKLEEIREFGQLEMKRVGMQVLPHWGFDNFDEAIQFLERNPGRYVFKPSGSAQDNKGWLFIGEEEDGADILELLKTNKQIWEKKIKTFQLQKYASGVEIAVGGFFNGKKFLDPVNINFEHKRIFPGDIGPLTGDMGALMFWGKRNGMFNATLAKIEPILAQTGYVGYFDINCIANGRGIYPLEFTCRFGYPTMAVQSEGIDMPLSEFFYKLASGEDFEIPTKRGFQLGVCCAVESLLSGDSHDIATYRDLSILFRKPNPSLEGICIGDIKMVDGTLRIAGESGYALVVTGCGYTVEEARRQAYNRIRNIRLQNMFYRVDIGERWLNESDLLQTWGYI